MKKIRTLAVSTALVLSLSACTSVTQDFVEGISGGWWSDEEATEKEEVSGENDEFPKLGTVPEKPDTPDIVKESEKLQSGLVADNQNARYSDQVIRSQAGLEESLENSTQVVPAVAAPPVAVQAEQMATSAPTPTPAPAAPAIATPAPTPVPAPAAITPAPVPAAPQPVATQPAPAPVATPTPVASPNVQTSAEAAAVISANRAEEEASNGTHIATLYYGRGVSVLSAHDKSVLAQVAAIYRQNGGRGVAVIGHASIPVSPAAPNPALVNYKVSLDRAVTVTNLLSALGVPSDLILMDARGANNPARLGDTAQDHAYNRRTEIYFLN